MAARNLILLVFYIQPLAPSMIIRILPSQITYPTPPSNLSTHPPSTSYLLNPHTSYTRSAEVLLRTESEFEKLVQMEKKLKDYAM
jgi:hypothetical protein